MGRGESLIFRRCRDEEPSQNTLAKNYRFASSDSLRTGRLPVGGVLDPVLMRVLDSVAFA